MFNYIMLILKNIYIYNIYFNIVYLFSNLVISWQSLISVAVLLAVTARGEFYLSVLIIP